MPTATLERPQAARKLTTAERADTLFRDGYRAGLLHGKVLVKNPAGVVYTVDPDALTCDCTAGRNGVLCKHLLGAASLLLDTAMSCDDTAPDCRDEYNRYTIKGASVRGKQLRLQDAAHLMTDRMERAGVAS